MYQEAKIKLWLLDDFWPDCVALIIHHIRDVLSFNLKYYTEYFIKSGNFY